MEVLNDEKPLSTGAINRPSEGDFPHGVTSRFYGWAVQYVVGCKVDSLAQYRRVYLSLTRLC
jgi:hypothetical protein